MRGSRSSRLLVTALAIAFGCLMVPITANAEITSDELRPFVNSDGTLSSSMSGYFSSGEGAGGEGKASVTVGDTTYYYSVDKEDTIKNAMGSAADIENVQSKLRDMNNMGIEADIASAQGIAHGAIPLVNTVVGFIVIVINLGMFLFTAVDIAYIIAPQFKEALDESGHGSRSGGPGGGGGGESKSKVRFITDNAEYAINAANTKETGKNPLWIYLKSRVWMYMVLGVVDFILLTGNISVFMNAAIRVAEGLLNLLSGLT